MKELFREINRESDARHRVMATLLSVEGPSKTLIYGYEIKYSAGRREFFENHIDEIVNVRGTGVYEIGGEEVYCEVLEEIPELVVCGAGHVGAACIRIAATLDMHIICIEDRQEFADLALEMGAHEVICSDYVSALKKIEGGESTYFLTMTRAHALDQLCLEQILRKPFAYAGMLGSSGKIRKIRSNLLKLGISGESFDRVHTPVGIDISANTPEEIAIAVLAEIISVKNTGKVITKAFDQQQLEAILNDEGEPILATVVRKRMPAPRDPGTKMIVTTDGIKHGTIGGGAAEAEALCIAREHMHDPDFVSKTITVGSEDKAGDGMVCGGVIDVLFERITNEVTVRPAAELETN